MGEIVFTDGDIINEEEFFKACDEIIFEPFDEVDFLQSCQITDADLLRDDIVGVCEPFR